MRENNFYSLLGERSYPVTSVHLNHKSSPNQSQVSLRPTLILDDLQRFGSGTEFLKPLKHFKNEMKWKGEQRPPVMIARWNLVEFGTGKVF